MTEKENYLKVINGEQPEWVPHITFAAARENAPTAMVAPSLFSHHRICPGPAKDCWGVLHIPVEEAGGAKIPKPNDFILKDICDWRNVIKLPDVSDIDFQADAEAQLARINREETAVIYDLSAGFFQLLIEFMGFTEGLCALTEEPDEVKALLKYLSDFTAEINEKCIDLYQPDLACLVDDTAAWKSPFISVNMYRELIKPFHAQQAKIATDRGLKLDMHNCGRCEDFIDDWIELGVVSWNPAQTSNDLLAIKKKYGNKLILTGCWDARNELLSADITEEPVKASVRKAIETYAAGGGYMFQGSFLGPANDPITQQKNKWVKEAAYEYGHAFYKKADD